MLKYFLHRQTFNVCSSKFSLFESQSGQPFKKCSTPRFFKRILSEVNVHCRNFRNESVSMLKHSKMNKKRNIKCPSRRPKLQLALLTCFFEESQLQLMLYVFEVTIVVPLFSFFSSKLFFYMYFSSFCTLLFQRGAPSEFPGVLRRSPPHRYGHVFGFLYGYRVESSRVEQSRATAIKATKAKMPTTIGRRPVAPDAAGRAGRAPASVLLSMFFLTPGQDRFCF